MKNSYLQNKLPIKGGKLRKKLKSNTSLVRFEQIQFLNNFLWAKNCFCKNSLN